VVDSQGGWHEYQEVYDAHAENLHWQQASFLSIEQRRRRQTHSSLPREHYRIAVLKHAITDAGTGQRLPGRLIFVHSSANEKFARERREVQIAKIQAGLEDLVGRVQRSHALVTPESVSRAIHRLFGKRWAARYFRWQLEALTPQEQAAMPPPKGGCRTPTYRLVFTFDAAAAEAEARYDGLSVLFTTAPLQHSADELTARSCGQAYRSWTRSKSRLTSTISASDDGTARIWDAQSGQPITGPLKHDIRVEHAAFSPDGCRHRLWQRLRRLFAAPVKVPLCGAGQRLRYALFDVLQRGQIIERLPFRHVAAQDGILALDATDLVWVRDGLGVSLPSRSACACTWTYYRADRPAPSRRNGP
jgi:hypothetical protein